MDPIDCLTELAVAIHYSDHAYVEESISDNKSEFKLVNQRTSQAGKEALSHLVDAAINQAQNSENPEDKKLVHLSIEAIHKRLEQKGKLPFFNIIRETRKAFLFSTEDEKGLEKLRAKTSTVLRMIDSWKDIRFEDDRAMRITVLSNILQDRQIRPQRPNESLRAFIVDFQKWMLTNGFELTTKQVIEIMKGAHVIIEDDAAWYKSVESREDKRARSSSHYAGSDFDAEGNKIQQYGIAGDLIHELLVGKIVSKDRSTGKITEKTWFQLENTPWAAGIQSVIGHSIDFIQYKISGNNVGPHGLSEHTDSNPIIFTKNKE